eukprot:897401-Prymnesium_polylepis.1
MAPFDSMNLIDGSTLVGAMEALTQAVGHTIHPHHHPHHAEDHTHHHAEDHTVGDDEHTANDTFSGTLRRRMSRKVSRRFSGVGEAMEEARRMGSCELQAMQTAAQTCATRALNVAERATDA